MKLHTRTVVRTSGDSHILHLYPGGGFPGSPFSMQFAKRLLSQRVFRSVGKEIHPPRLARFR